MIGKKLLMVGLAIICLLWLQTPAFCQESLGLSDLQHSLKMRGARWAAGENSMTRLSHEERQKRLGLLLPVHTGKQPLLSLEEAPLLTLPTALDWRNNGGNFVTPIRDQGSCGSCWAFASTGALESNALIANQTPGIDLNLSEQVLISCGGGGSCGGGTIDDSAEFFKYTGLPVESCYPYTATDGTCSKACSNWQANTYRISSYQEVSAIESSLKTALYNYGPLATTMAVFEDFFSYHSGVYHYVAGGLAGYHAVLLVGYDDVGQYFIVKNSWGTWWGESGFFRIAYSELHSGSGLGSLGTLAFVSAPACPIAVSQPSPASFPASAGSGSVSVTTASNCSWTASSNDSWIGITSGASGTGSGTVAFSVSANTGTSRTGTLKVGGQTLSVTQAAGAAPCTYSIYPVQQPFDAAGGTGSLAVTAGSGCAWTAKSNAAWITITAGSTGTGSGTAVYSVAANQSTASRTGTLTIADKTFTVTQDGLSCTYSITPTTKTFGASGGTYYVKVTSKTGCSWTASKDVDWITITSGGSGSGNGQVNYAVTVNGITSPRTGTITILGKACTVTQKAAPTVPSISVSPASLDFGTVSVNAPVSKTVTVSNNGTGDLTIKSVSITGTNPRQFRQTGNCTTVAPGSSCSITATFAPTANGTKSATLKIYSNDSARNPVSIPLSGIGLK